MESQTHLTEAGLKEIREIKAGMNFVVKISNLFWLRLYSSKGLLSLFLHNNSFGCKAS